MIQQFSGSAPSSETDLNRLFELERGGAVVW